MNCNQEQDTILSNENYKALIYETNFQQQTPNYDQEQVLNYLLNKQFVTLIPFYGMATDPQDGLPLQATCTRMSDGTYHWSDKLAAYIKKYGIQLPEEFIRHIEKNYNNIKDPVNSIYNVIPHQKKQVNKQKKR